MRERFDILRLDRHADGIAQGGLRIPRTLPGETVSGILDGATLREVRIEQPSSDRVRPPCRHYGTCGGCRLQHAAEDFTARWKVETVRSALAAQGIEADFLPVHTSPPGSRRRAVLSARRTRKGAIVGFHGRASDSIAEISGCRLLAPELLAALPVAEDLARTGASRKGELAVTATLSQAGLDVAVRNGKALDGPRRQALARLAERHDLARLAWEDEIIATRRAPWQTFGRARVVPPPGAFLQATADGEAALLQAVRAAVGQASRIADLFAGCGTFALPLAEGARVHAVETDAQMLAALDRGWRHCNGLRPVTTEARDLFRRPLDADELTRFDAVVIDPPRAGAEAQIALIARARVPVVAHVSCNPVSFAHDARILTGAGYRMGAVRVVDQFRWSAHVELVASFTLEP